MDQLKDCHYKILQATTASKAKNLLSEFPVDAVLLSLDLPDYDVVTLIADIRRCKKNEKLRLLYWQIISMRKSCIMHCLLVQMILL